MTSPKKNIFGYATGIAAADRGCGDGPQWIFEKYPLTEMQILLPKTDKNTYRVVAELSSRLSKLTAASYKAQQFFIVLGGDHSSAIGTWSGVVKEMPPKGELGLIWIDAHLDAHTPTSSLSGNIHGMPVATLLGKGDSQLISIQGDKPKIKPENLCLIGIRSFEAEELQLMQQLQVKMYSMEDINTRGLEVVMLEAKERVKKNTLGYGISLDLDGLDPMDAPGVGTPEKDGIRAVEFIEVFKKYFRQDKELIGFEIAEFNPHHDIDAKTEKLIVTLLELL